MRTVFEIGLRFALKVLQMNLIVQTKASFDFFNGAGISAECVIDVMARLHVVRIVGELATTKILHVSDGGAFRFHFLRNYAYEFFDAAIRSLGVENDDTFIFPAHVTD